MPEGSKDGAALVPTLFLAIGLAMPMASTAAQSVQKCIATDGHVTLTSGDCADGQVLAKTYDAVPEPAAAQAAPSRIATPARSGSRSTPRATARSRGKPPPDRCQAARDRREQTLRRVGLKRTFDLLRKLDDEVWAACR